MKTHKSGTAKVILISLSTLKPSTVLFRHFATRTHCASLRGLAVKRPFSSGIDSMSEGLVHLDDVTRLNGTVVRILAGNPGKFTLQGK